MDEEKQIKTKKTLISVAKYAVTVIITAAVVMYLSGASFEQMYLHFLMTRYYDGEIDGETVREDTLSGMVAGLGDEHSYYIPKEIGYQLFNESVTGEYGGIGVEIQSKDNEYTVTKVFEGGPAEKAGVLTGDKILSVNGADTKKMETDISDLVRGEIGSNVKLGLQRGKKTLNVTITREQINAPTVEAEILDNNIGYVKISQFDMDTDAELEKAMDNMKGISGVIIDLRDNPGGILQTCLRCLELYTNEGETLVVASYKGHEEEYKAESAAKYKMPMVVLANENSASSSEIFTACVKDLKRATVVGAKTYGKGSIQRTFTLPENAGANITVGHFYSPNKTQIDKKGITPDVKVKQDKNAETDAQLQSAIEILKK